MNYENWYILNSVSNHALWVCDRLRLQLLAIFWVNWLTNQPSWAIIVHIAWSMESCCRPRCLELGYFWSSESDSASLWSCSYNLFACVSSTSSLTGVAVAALWLPDSELLYIFTYFKVHDISVQAGRWRNCTLCLINLLWKLVTEYWHCASMMSCKLGNIHKFSSVANQSLRYINMADGRD